MKNWHQRVNRVFARTAGIPARRATWVLCVLLAIMAWVTPIRAQETGHATEGNATPPTATQSEESLQRRVDQLEAEVAQMKRLVSELQAIIRTGHNTLPTDIIPAASQLNAAPIGATAPEQPSGTGPVPSDTQDRKTLEFLRDTTINLNIDTYYSYNFRRPVGRVNLLRAYDVLSNNFSLNQASAIFEHAPDIPAGRRWGARLDLQFGQATDTLQGNPANEPRPTIYRHIFQAYGTYILPLGKGLTVDFGKWASSLGIENNYTKDQMNYSRSFFFAYLPFYHMGVRMNYPVDDRLTLSYWIVNGTNQTEATNGFKDQMFGFVLKPRKTITWTSNYYYGQDNPDRIVLPGCGPLPVQPDLCFQAIRPAPDGRLHIIDNYVTWQAGPKLALAAEWDYAIQRVWRHAAPGRSSAPSHVIGGVAYARYQFTPKLALAGRAEYLSDRGGLFSGITQALKETTLTFDYNLTEGFLMRYEWRRDFSNQPSFLTNLPGVLGKQQNTATVGLVWWWGRKEGVW